jgi:hypothetical protein
MTSTDLPKRSTSLLLRTLLAAAIVFSCLIQTVVFSWIYTNSQLQAARRNGVFPSAEEGMLSLTSEGYLEPREIKIIYAGPNSFNREGAPHVWFVVACVWAEKRVDGSQVGNGTNDFDFPGSYFLHARDGWVLMPEGAFPEFVGFWMKVFGLAGPGSSQPSHEREAGSRTGCER